MGFFAALRYGFPSRKLIVVGVTGTTGKTTVVYMIAHMLENAGIKVGYTSTAMFHDGKNEWLNDKKMTMLGRSFTQRMLRTMTRNGCQVAIVETTSEGAVQFRHRFINYDIFLVTGLYPEHIESHGGFENYKNAKLSLFEHLGRCGDKSLKTLGVVSERLKKTVIVNGDDAHAADFLAVTEEIKKMAFSMQNVSFDGEENVEHLYYRYDTTTARGVRFEIDTMDVQLALLGEFTATNAAAAAAVGRALGIRGTWIKSGLEKIAGIPGRLERITCGQDFTVIVDYAFEPVALTKLYETVRVLAPEKIIHVLGSAGGGRDTVRRPELGRIAGTYADHVIITDEDPYDENPRKIMEDVAAGVEDQDKVQIIEDRGKAIEYALSCASTGDLVLITGKGSEQAIAVEGGRHIPWDDRTAVQEFFGV